MQRLILSAKHKAHPTLHPIRNLSHGVVHVNISQSQLWSANSKIDTCMPIQRQRRLILMIIRTTGNLGVLIQLVKGARLCDL